MVRKVEKTEAKLAKRVAKPETKKIEKVPTKEKKTASERK